MCLLRLESFHSSRAFLSLILTPAPSLGCSTPTLDFPSPSNLPPPRSPPHTRIAKTPQHPLEGRRWMPEGEDRRVSRVFQSPEVRHFFLRSSLPKRPRIGARSLQLPEPPNSKVQRYSSSCLQSRASTDGFQSLARLRHGTKPASKGRGDCHRNIHNFSIGATVHVQ